jgi:ATP-dependent DNA helicase RecG
MFEALLRLGRSGPDYSASNEKTVVVSIPTSDADLEMVRFVVEYEDSVGAALPLRQLWLLHILKEGGPAPVDDLAQELSATTSVVRSELARLAEAGLVEQRGSGRSRRYHLTTAFYRTADSNEYVRLRGFDPLQQEQMVLSYVDAWGSITRGKAAELCRIAPQQARTLLKRLVDAGTLELRGERRGAHYVRKES